MMDPRLPIPALLLLASCASAPGDPALERARRHRDSGELERALRYTERAMQQRAGDSQVQEIASLHLEILRALDRTPEAEAFEEFVGRFAAGQDTDTPDTDPSFDDCARLQRRRSGPARLVREYGALPIHLDFEVGTLAARYEVGEDGQPREIRVLRARRPASAWLVIDSISEARVSRVRRAELDPGEFPVPHCVAWRFH